MKNNALVMIVTLPVITGTVNIVVHIVIGYTEILNPTAKIVIQWMFERTVKKLMIKIDPKELLDITDLRSSIINFTLLNEILILNEKVDALTEIIMAHKLIDPLGLDVVMTNVSNKPEYQSIHAELVRASAAILAAQSDPKARLQAMFKAKMEGRF